jgi:hypothetical protein
MNPNRPTADLPAFAADLRARLQASRDTATAPMFLDLTWTVSAAGSLNRPTTSLPAFARDLRGRLEASRALANPAFAG